MGGHRAEILPEPLLHHLGVVDASQCFNNPPLPTPPLLHTLPPFPGLSFPPALMSQWDLSKSPLPPLFFTDPSLHSFSSSFSSSIHILPSPQDPEAGWCYKRRGYVSLRKLKNWLAWHLGTVAIWLFTQFKNNSCPYPNFTS